MRVERLTGVENDGKGVLSRQATDDAHVSSPGRGADEHHPAAGTQAWVIVTEVNMQKTSHTCTHCQ